MTASRTRRSRSVSSGDGITQNVAMISKTGQPGCEGVEAKPSLGCQADHFVVELRPARSLPLPAGLEIVRRSGVASGGPKTEIDALGCAIFRRQDLGSV